MYIHPYIHKKVEGIRESSHTLGTFKGCKGKSYDKYPVNSTRYHPQKQNTHKGETRDAAAVNKEGGIDVLLVWSLLVSCFAQF